MPAQLAPETAPSSMVAALRAVFRNHGVRCLLLLVIGFVVRTPALQGVPIWDDDYLLGENPFAKSPLLAAEAFRHHLFLDSLSAHYRPVQNISFAFDYLFWNTTWYGYHLTNVLLHIGSGLFLYLLLRQLLPGLLKATAARSAVAPEIGAYTVALLWVVHPVHSAAVDYMSGRADSLAFFFAAGAWLLYLQGAQAINRLARFALYGSAILSGMLALGSREIACVWLALFLLHSFIFQENRSFRVSLSALACCLLMLVAYGALRQLPIHRSRPPQSSWSAPMRGVLMLRALGDYGRLTVWPSRLGMERNVIEPKNYGDTESWRKSATAEYLSILGLGVLGALVCGVSRPGPGRRLRVFGVLWFTAGFLPISNLVELNATVAEHWLYLPLVGLLLFLVGCVVDLPRRYHALAGGLAVVALGGLGARAWVRSSDWLTPRTFYERTIASGGSSMRVTVNLAVIYANNGEDARAEAAFRRVLSMVPDYPVARSNLADLLRNQGRDAEAQALLQDTKAAASEMKKTYPRTWMSAVKLASIQQEKKDPAGARAILENARNEYPEIWPIIAAESELVRLTKGPDEAMQLVADYARDHWWHYRAAFAYGQLLAEKGDAEGAAEQLRRASWLDVHDVRALSLLAAVRFRQERFDEAYSAQRQVVSRQPDESSQYSFLATILTAMGRSAEAEAALVEMANLRSLAAVSIAR